MTIHQRKVEAVNTAVEELASDTTVDQKTILQDLKDVVDRITEKLARSAIDKLTSG